MVKKITAILVLAVTSAPVMAKDDSASHMQQCLPDNYHWIMKKIVKHESGFNPIAINVNGYRLKRKPTSKEEAIAWSEYLINKGYSVDMGLSQVNSQHFKPGKTFSKMGLTIADAFNECTNLKMGAYIYATNHIATNGNVAQALSLYNTGNVHAGLKNGYVQKVIAN
jgi:type IV secretion system protein VirB1